MLTEVEVGQAGEQCVARWLRGKGYATNVDTKAPGSTDIEARSANGNVLVQVKSAVSPNQPASISSDEERNIKSRASNLGYQAWEARVTLSASLQLMGSIQWRRLV